MFKLRISEEQAKAFAKAEEECGDISAVSPELFDSMLLDRAETMKGLSNKLEPLYWICRRYIETYSLFEEALSIIRSAQTNAVYNEAKAFMQRIEGK